MHGDGNAGQAAPQGREVRASMALATRVRADAELCAAHHPGNVLDATLGQSGCQPGRIVQLRRQTGGAGQLSTLNLFDRLESNLSQWARRSAGSRRTRS